MPTYSGVIGLNRLHVWLFEFLLVTIIQRIVKLTKSLVCALILAIGSVSKSMSQP